MRTPPAICPLCALALTGLPSCPRCACPLTGPEAQRLWELDCEIFERAADLEELRHTRLQQLRLLESARYAALSAASVPVPQSLQAPLPSPAPAPDSFATPPPLPTLAPGLTQVAFPDQGFAPSPARDAAPRSIQRLLLTLGVAATGVGVLIFAVFTYATSSPSVRLLLALLALTLACGAARYLRERLPASAEAAAALALCFGVAATALARTLGLLPGEDLGFLTGATLLLALLAALLASLRLVTGLALAPLLVHLALLLHLLDDASLLRACAALALVLVTDLAIADLLAHRHLAARHVLTGTSLPADLSAETAPDWEERWPALLRPLVSVLAGFAALGALGCTAALATTQPDAATLLLALLALVAVGVGFATSRLPELLDPAQLAPSPQAAPPQQLPPPQLSSAQPGPAQPQLNQPWAAQPWAGQFQAPAWPQWPGADPRLLRQRVQRASELAFRRFRARTADALAALLPLAAILLALDTHVSRDSQLWSVQLITASYAALVLLLASLRLPDWLRPQYAGAALLGCAALPLLAALAGLLSLTSLLADPWEHATGTGLQELLAFGLARELVDSGALALSGVVSGFVISLGVLLARASFGRVRALRLLAIVVASLSAVLLAFSLDLPAWALVALLLVAAAALVPSVPRRLRRGATALGLASFALLLGLASPELTALAALGAALVAGGVALRSGSLDTSPEPRVRLSLAAVVLTAASATAAVLVTAELVGASATLQGALALLLAALCLAAGLRLHPPRRLQGSHPPRPRDALLAEALAATLVLLACALLPPLPAGLALTALALLLGASLLLGYPPPRLLARGSTVLLLTLPGLLLASAQLRTPTLALALLLTALAAAAVAGASGSLDAPHGESRHLLTTLATLLAALAGSAALLATLSLLEVAPGVLAAAALLIAVLAAGVAALLHPPARLSSTSRPRDALLAEAVALAATALALLLSPSLETSSWILTAVALTLAASGTRPARSWCWELGVVAATAASWIRLAISDVELVECYTLPPALALIGLALLRARLSITPRPPQLAPGLAAALAPSTLLALTAPLGLRAALLTVVATALLVLGARARLRIPLLAGAGVLGLLILRTLLSLVTEVPPAATITATGVLLLVLGATYEARRRQLARAAEFVRSCR